MISVLEIPGALSAELIELTHPGKTLREDFLEPMGLSAEHLSEAMSVPLSRILAIIQGERDISAETSLLLDKFFGLSDGYWLRLQSNYNLRKARRSLTKKIARVRPYSDAVQPSESRKHDGSI